MIRIILLGCLCVSGAIGQLAKPDACSPPPGSVPPSLPARLLEGQGTVNFPITTRSPEAQAFFNQGVAQLHSFWVNEAERSFLQSAQLDPEAPMPWWGIAMVAAGDYRPGFQLDFVNGGPPKPEPYPANPSGGLKRSIEAARKALQLSEMPGKATELEKLYIAAAAARRDVKSTNPNGDYVEALRQIVRRYPGEVEARSFLALQLMSGFTQPDKKPRAGSLEAVEILRQLAKDAPEHPGVHHYIIHGWEGSDFARDAWPSCERYGALAFNIPHGLHMPGHIYAQTGRWGDAAATFSKAAENEVDWMQADSLNGNRHHGHNVHFLAMSYSFNGEYEKAIAAARSLFQFKETPRELGEVDNFRTAWREGWRATLRTLVQHERWDDIIEGMLLPSYDKPRERAWRHWALGLARCAKSQPKPARQEYKLMENALADYRKAVKKEPPPYLLVARDELRAQIDLASGKLDKGLGGMQKAAAAERRLRYNEPTSYPRPILEVLGRYALKHNRIELAEKAFREALDQYPESAGAKRGLQAAAQALKNASVAGY